MSWPGPSPKPWPAAWVDQAISDSGATAPGDVGRVMGALMKAHKGEIDAGLAKRIAGERLGAG